MSTSMAAEAVANLLTRHALEFVASLSAKTEGETQAREGRADMYLQIALDLQDHSGGAISIDFDGWMVRVPALFGPPTDPTPFVRINARASDVALSSESRHSLGEDFIKQAIRAIGVSSRRRARQASPLDISRSYGRFLACCDGATLFYEAGPDIHDLMSDRLQSGLLESVTSGQITESESRFAYRKFASGPKQSGKQ